MCCSTDQRASRVAFELAEALPTNSLESHKHQSRFLWQERLSLSKWFRKRSTAVTAFTVIRCREDWKNLLVKSSSAARQQLVNLTHPKGPGTCDHNAAERGINLVTSLPFFALGWQAFRQAKSEESRLWGASIMGVGAGAMAFHASAGEHRHWGRKLDYWVISLSTAALTRAIYPNISGHKTAASLLLTPMQPLAVTTLNAAAMEVEFLKQARRNPELRPAHRVHLGATVLGAGCFVLEDFRPTLPLIHSVWHGLSAVALHTTNALVADADRRKMQKAVYGKKSEIDTEL